MLGAKKGWKIWSYSRRVGEMVQSVSWKRTIDNGYALRLFKRWHYASVKASSLGFMLAAWDPISGPVSEGCEFLSDTIPPGIERHFFISHRLNLWLPMMHSINRKWLKPLHPRASPPPEVNLQGHETANSPRTVLHMCRTEGTTEDSRVVFSILFSPASKMFPMSLPNRVALLVSKRRTWLRKIKPFSNI